MSSLFRFLMYLFTIDVVLASQLTFSNRVNDSSILFLYTFEEGQLAPLSTVSLDVTHQNYVGGLQLGSQSARWIYGRTGVNFLTSGYGYPLLSQSALGPIQSKLQISRAFTFEVWISYSTISQAGEIVGFGKLNSSSACNSLNLLQIIGGYQASLLGTLCFTMYDNAISTGLTHIVLTATPRLMYLYANGLQLAASSISPLFNWDSSMHLTGGSINNTWSGSVMLLSMYSRYFSSSDVLQNFQAGLPNQKPVIFASPTLTVIQDTLTLVNLTITAFDADSDNVTTFLIGLPHVGNLLDLNGSLVQAPLVIHSSFQYFYQPPIGLWGINVTNLQFVATDLFGSGPEFAVTIDIRHIIVAPLAFNVTYSVNVGKQVAIVLKGVDLDPSLPLHANVSSFELLSLPSFGSLYLESELGSTSLISSIPFKASSNSSLTYVSVNRSFFQSGQTIVGSDQFMFTVTIKGTSSQIGFVNFHVINPLLIPPQHVDLTSRVVTVQLNTSLAESIMVQLLAFPQLGVLLFPNGTFVPSDAIFPQGLMLYQSYQKVYDRNVNLLSDSFSFQFIDSNYFQSPVIQVLIQPGHILYPPVLESPVASLSTIVNLAGSAVFTNLSLNVSDYVANDQSAFLVDINTNSPNLLVRIDAQFRDQIQSLNKLIPLPVTDFQSTAEYKCQLLGLRSTLSSVQFQGLSPGTYTIEVIVNRADDPLSQATVKVLIFVYSAPTSSPSDVNSIIPINNFYIWFAVGCFAVIAIFVFIFRRCRLNSKLRASADKSKSKTVKCTAIELQSNPMNEEIEWAGINPAHAAAHMFDDSNLPT